MDRKVILKGEHISLVVLETKDVELYYEGINNIQTQHYLGYTPRTFSFEDEKQFLENINKDEKSQVFCIMVNDTKKVIGNVGLKEINHMNKCGVLGIVIFDENERGNGYGNEAIQLLHGFAKNYLNLRKICLHVFGDNKRAIKLYSKLGYQEVGRWKKHKFYNGDFVDDVMMEIFL